MNTIKIWRYTWQVNKYQYGNWRVALVFEDSRTDETIETLTVNLVDEDVNNNEAFINVNSSLWNDIITVLKSEWIITDLIWYSQSGFVSYPKYKVTL